MSITKICRPPFILVLSSPARLSMNASASASFWKRMPQLHSAPTDLRDLGGSTCLSSVPCAYAHTWLPVKYHSRCHFVICTSFCTHLQAILRYKCRQRDIRVKHGVKLLPSLPARKRVVHCTLHQWRLPRNRMSCLALVYIDKVAQCSDWLLHLVS